jgi:hypothetical protein
MERNPRLTDSLRALVDADGQRVLSRRVVNDEAALIDLVQARCGEGAAGHQ